MKKNLVNVLLVSGILLANGCYTLKDQYLTEVETIKQKDSNSYAVKTKLYKKNNGKNVLLLQPTVIVENGKEGTVKIGQDSDNKVDIVTTVEEQGENVNTNVLFTILENGKEVKIVKKLITKK